MFSDSALAAQNEMSGLDHVFTPRGGRGTPHSPQHPPLDQISTIENEPLLVPTHRNRQLLFAHENR
jgi:hypothetical protein